MVGMTVWFTLLTIYTVVFLFEDQDRPGFGHTGRQRRQDGDRDDSPECQRAARNHTGLERFEITASGRRSVDGGPGIASRFVSGNSLREAG